MIIRRTLSRFRRPAPGQMWFWFILSPEPIYLEVRPLAPRRSAPSKGRILPPWRRGRRGDRPGRQRQRWQGKSIVS
jgi:hypothetical protein